MKKLLSIALALMLLLASAACAEGTYVGRISNIEMNATQEGQQADTDLSDLEICLAAGLANEMPTLRVECNTSDGQIYGLNVQCVDGRVLMQVDGVSKAVYADAGTFGAMFQSTLESMLANPESLLETKLPEIPVITIPKLDLVSFPAMFGAETNGSAFAVPYQTINSLLSMLSMYRSLIPEQFAAYVNPLFDIVDQMAETNSGFQLEGTVENDGDRDVMDVGLFMVSEGERMGDAIGSLHFESAENEDYIVVTANNGGNSVEIAEGSVYTDMETGRTDFTMLLMNQFGLVVSLYKDNDGLQNIDFRLSPGDQHVDLSAVYGPKDEGDYTALFLEVANQITASVTDIMQSDGNGGKVGAIAVLVDSDTAGLHFDFSGDVEEVISDIQLEGIPSPEEAIAIEEATQDEQYAEEMNTAQGVLMDYLNSVTTVPAA